MSRAGQLLGQATVQCEVRPAAAPAGARWRLRVVLPVGRQPVLSGQPSQRPAWLPAGPLVGYVGRLQPEKGIAVLLEAMRL